MNGIESRSDHAKWIGNGQPHSFAAVVYCQYSAHALKVRRYFSCAESSLISLLITIALCNLVV